MSSRSIRGVGKTLGLPHLLPNLLPCLLPFHAGCAWLCLAHGDRKLFSTNDTVRQSTRGGSAENRKVGGMAPPCPLERLRFAMAFAITLATDYGQATRGVSAR